MSALDAIDALDVVNTDFGELCQKQCLNAVKTQIPISYLNILIGACRNKLEGSFEKVN